MNDVARMKRDLLILKQHNAWRRGDDTIQPTDPKALGLALETAIEVMDKLIFVSEG